MNEKLELALAVSVLVAFMLGGVMVILPFWMTGCFWFKAVCVLALYGTCILAVAWALNVVDSYFR